MSNISGLNSTGPIPTPDQPEPSAASAAPERGGDNWLDGVGSFFRNIWSRLNGRGDRLEREDGPVQVRGDAKEIVGRDAGTTFATRDEVLSAYRERLGELDTHFQGQRAGGGDTKAINKEARRADHDLTLLFANKARGLVGGDIGGLVDELLAAKTGLKGLKVDAGDYKKDLDHDGLSARAELLAGSSDYAVDTDLDGLTDIQEVKAGLDASAPRTETSIESDGWSIEGLVWYPYFDDKPPLAFSKFDQVFGTEASKEFEAFFEGYSAGAQGPRGTWLPKPGSGRPGHVKESDFARTSGVNPVDEPTIPTEAVRLMRQSGAPQSAQFSLREGDGSAIKPEAGDRMKPTYVDGGAAKLAEVRSVEGKPVYFKPGTNERVSGDVSYRLVGKDGAIRGGADAKRESRNELLGLRPNLKFDFLDKANQTVDFNARRGDQVVATYKDGDSWVALVPEKGADGAVTGYEKQTYDKDGTAVQSTEALSTDAAKALLDDQGSDAMYRVRSGAGALRGDGEVSSYFDAYWWGKCHNTAKIDQSNMAQPKNAVQVAQGVEPGETLAARFTAAGQDHVLKPERDGEGAITGYQHLVGGSVTETLNPAAAALLLKDKGASPVIVGADGAVRDAEVLTVSPEEVQTLVAHMGQGATEYKGSVGSRFYATPDRITLAGGKTLDNVRILSAETEGGESFDVQEREGGEWKDLHRGLFRGEDVNNSKTYRGSRSVAFTESSMASINEGRADDFKSLKVQHPDGRIETINAGDVEKIGRENAYDMSPADIWGAAQMIEDGKSFTLEKATGPQVWNYAVKELATERIDRSKVPAGALKADGMPGAMTGSTSTDGRLYFKSEINYLENGKSNDKSYYYWVKMDDEGKITDFNYLVDPTDTKATFAAAPDFFWQTHVKDPVDERWSGESEIPGAAMSDIQGLYNASIGNMEHLSVLGVFTADDLADGRPKRP